MPKTIFYTILTLIIAGASGASFYFYTQWKDLQHQALVAPVSDEVKTMVARVGAHMILPEEEEPTVATVSGSEKLKEQGFFDTAKKGDKILVYTGAKRAILYDPIADRIIDIVSLSFTAPAPAPAVPPPSTTSTKSKK